MAVDISGISYFNPILTFVLLFVLVYAILEKTKIIGETKAIQAIVSLILSAIFASVFEVRSYVESVTPWFAVLVVALFFVIFLAAFGLKDPGSIMKPWLIWVFIGLLAIVFLYQGYNVFDVAGNHDYLSIKDWIQEPKVAGGLWLGIFAIITVFAVTRKAAGK